jgi:hypothetical protein
MSWTRCDHVTDDGSVCGQQCEEAASWRVNNQAEDDSDYEEFVVCNFHLHLVAPWIGICRSQPTARV